MLIDFDGADYNEELDKPRLDKQFNRIFNVMRDGQWRTLNDIQRVTGDPQASISAQLRHMRKPRFGGYIINRRRAEGKESSGLFEYQLLS